MTEKASVSNCQRAGKLLRNSDWQTGCQERGPGSDHGQLHADFFKALDAAEKLKAYDVDAEVIDLRSIHPLNYEKLIASIKKTGKVVLVNRVVERGKVMHNIAANLT